MSAAAVALLGVLSLAAAGVRAEERKSTGYPTVGDTPPRPDKPAMTADDISRLKKALTTAHDRQAPKEESKDGAARLKH